MRVTVFGAGYVGLTTGVALALTGQDVCVHDIDAPRIEVLRRGQVPFHEPQLAELMALAAPRLTFEAAARDALHGARVVIIAVGTPPSPAGNADLSSIVASARAIIDHAPIGPLLVVIKSTVPVGTGASLRDMFAGAGRDDIHVVGNPEFLRQGQAMRDTLHPDRLVFGAECPEDFELLETLYAPIISQSFPVLAPSGMPQDRTPVPVVRTRPESAELAKLAANAFLAMKISFANEIANVCDHTGADIREVTSVLGLDTRINPHFLQAGLGYGGSCFPKDTRALQYLATRGGYTFRLLTAVIEVNNAQRFRVLGKLERVLGSLRGRTVALLGLTFKANTDDMRDAPSVDLSTELLAHGVQVRAHDPVGLENARRVLDPRVQLCGSVREAVAGADAVILVTEWPEYARLDWRELRDAMRRPFVVDGRNFLDPSTLEALGFEYRGIGRAPRHASREVVVS